MPKKVYNNHRIMSFFKSTSAGWIQRANTILEQFSLPENGEFTTEDIDKYVFGLRVYEDHFEWLLNLNPDTRGELDDAGSPVYFKKITVTPDDEKAWFKEHPKWSKSNKYVKWRHGFIFEDKRGTG